MRCCPGAAHDLGPSATPPRTLKTTKAVQPLGRVLDSGRSAFLDGPHFRTVPGLADGVLAPIGCQQWGGTPKGGPLRFDSPAARCYRVSVAPFVFVLFFPRLEVW